MPIMRSPGSHKARARRPRGAVKVAREQALPSGRSVLLKLTGAAEELEVRSPQGDVEVRITLSDQGPVVHLRGARLELEAPDTIALNCRHLEVNTEDSTLL